MRLPRPTRIFARILLVALPPILLLAVLLSTYIVNARLDDLQSAFEDRGNANARQMASAALLGLFTDDREMLQHASRQHLMRDAELIAVIVRNRSGRTVAKARRDSVSDERSSSWFRARVEPPSMIRGELGAIGSPPPLGEVAVRFSNRGAEDAAAQILRNSLLIVSFAVLFTLLVSVVVARQIVRPIVRLQKAVKRVQEGDFGVRVPETTSGEIGELEAGFNTMADTVARSADELTEEVARATSDLQQTMDALEVRNVELDLARRRALEASEAKSEFLANMSHEIRTPMNGVLGFAGLLRQSSLDDHQRQYVDVIIESANSLMADINDILEFSKMEAGKLTLEHRPFSLRDTLGDAVNLFAAQAQDKGLGLLSQVDADVPDGLVGDALRLRQILNNLIGNAVKFTETGEVAIRVGRFDRSDDRVRLGFRVSDTGIGIPSHIMDQLFQPFSQGALSTTRLYGGTGLGLSICRSLTAAMGGEIRGSSLEGGGSEFTVTLPFDQAAATLVDGQSSALVPAECASTDWLEGRLLLIADDNAINLRLIDALLSRLGATTIKATDGQQAVELALANPVDLAFVDIHMPRLNGIEAAARIRLEKADLPIVALTADATLMQRLSSDNDDLFACLVKPIDVQMLRDVIASALGKDSPVASVVPAPRSVARREGSPMRDRRRAIEQAAGSEVIADALFSDFLEALPEAVAEIHAAHAAKDWERLWQAAHRLQGAAATCSLPALFEALKRLAQAARGGDGARISSAVAEVRDQADRLTGASAPSSDVPAGPIQPTAPHTGSR